MKNKLLLLTLSFIVTQSVLSQKIEFGLQGDLWGLKKGSQWIIQPKYDVKYDFDNEGYALVGIDRVRLGLPDDEFGKDDDNAMMDNLSVWGIVSNKGVEVLAPKYDQIIYSTTELGFAGPLFMNGAAIIRKGRYYGFIDMKGNEIIKPKYTKVNSFNNNGAALVAYAINPCGKDFYKIDKQGKLFFENNEMIQLDKNGRVTGEGKEVNGKKTGEWKFYHDNCALIATENYNSSGALHGVYKKFFAMPGGFSHLYPLQEGNYENGKINGIVKFYQPDKPQTLTYTEIWENGVFKRVGNIYTINGTLISSSGDGLAVGYVNDSGKPAYKINYKKGHRDGYAEWFHKNGKLKQAVMYKYDTNEPYGLRWEILEVNDTNGNPLPKGTLKNGNGTWISYDDNNKPTIITTYKDGKKVSEAPYGN